MNKQKKTDIKVGVTVVVGTVLLIWVLGWAKNVSFTDNHNTVKVKFNSTSGLSDGDLITVNGVKAGYVQSIQLVDNFPLLELKIDRNVSLKSDAKFSIMMLDLMGGKKIEIFPGNESTLLNLDEMHTGEFVGDIATAMAALSSVQGDIVTLIKEVRSAVTKINSSYLSDDFISNVTSGLNNLNSLLTETTKVLKANKGNVADLIANTNSLVKQSSKLIDENEKGIETGINGLNELLSNSNKLVKRIDMFVEETVEQENNLGKAMYDEKMLEDLKKTLSATNELLKILLEQIKDEGINVDANIF